MKKELFIVLFFLFTVYHAHSQTQNDTISIVRNLFECNGKILNTNQVLDLMKDNPEALAAMKRAKSNASVASVFAYIGGFCIGYPIGQAIGGAKPAWAMAGIGAGFILIALPINGSAKENSVMAVRLYNAKIKQSGSYSSSINFGLTSNGLGLICSF